VSIILQDYGSLPKLVDLLLSSGFNGDEAGKIVGGNYLRLFGASMEA
jgi:microsomal dipeptidase-like Zn-dependent dipeptidase